MWVGVVGSGGGRVGGRGVGGGSGGRYYICRVSRYNMSNRYS